jgi:hypothetical protein
VNFLFFLSSHGSVASCLTAAPFAFSFLSQ